MPDDDDGNSSPSTMDEMDDDEGMGENGFEEEGTSKCPSELVAGTEVASSGVVIMVLFFFGLQTWNCHPRHNKVRDRCDTQNDEWQVNS